MKLSVKRWLWGNGEWSLQITAPFDWQARLVLWNTSRRGPGLSVWQHLGQRVALNYPRMT